MSPLFASFSAFSIVAFALLWLCFGASSAFAQQNWTVQAGWLFYANTSWEALSFIPDTLTINAGDSVTWIWYHDHTVTFWPSFRSTFINLDTLQYDASLFPVGGTTISSQNVLYSSGLQNPPFSWTATFPVAGTFPYFCVRHPGMTATITVLPASELTPFTPEEVLNNSMQSIADLQSNVIPTLEAQVPLQAPSEPDPSRPGATVYTINIGAEGASQYKLSRLRFAPDSIAVQTGDTLQFILVDFAGHTVNFNLSGLYWDVDLQLANGVLLGSQYFYRSYGDNTNWVGQFVSSGILNPPSIPFGVNHWNITFGDALPSGIYRWICNLHDGEGMVGYVTVTQRQLASAGSSTVPGLVLMLLLLMLLSIRI